MRIRVRWNKGELEGTLDDTPTARALYESLPFTSRANTWGEEVYFDAPVAAKLEHNARQVVDPGAICYWVQGQSLALPYGRTPVSEANECRLVTAVNVLGRFDGDPRKLATVAPGAEITVETAD
jgi:hypothetical protein